MITVTLKYGLSKVLSNIEVEEGSSLSSLVAKFGTALGLPESWNAIVDGEVVNSSYYPESGDTIVFEKRACAKA